jgi:hypothetical protein
MLENKEALGNDIADVVMASMNVLGILGDLRGSGKRDSRLVILEDDGRGSLREAKIREQLTVVHALLDSFGKSHIFRFHGPGRDAAGLAASIGVDRSTVAPDTNVEASLTTTICMNSIGSIRVDVELRSFSSIIAGSKMGPSIEIRENTQGLLIARYSRSSHSACEELNCSADVVTSTETKDETSDDMTESVSII